MRKAVFLFILFALVACGGGGDSSPQTSGGGTWRVNAAGYPDVAGVYSCNVVAGSAVCTDGSTGAYPPLAMNFRVTQSNNQVTLFNTSSAGPPAGTTVLWSDNFNGNVDLDGNFVIDQNVIMRTITDPGNFTLTYTFTGAFDPNGWAGTYQLTAYSDFYRVSCTYTSQFTGNRTAQDSYVIAPSENIERRSGDIILMHDFMGLSSFLGL